jgi:hypothetical protein
MAGLASVLLWLNRSPWWGWNLVFVLIAAFVATARWWSGRGVLLRLGAWLVAVTVVCGAAVLAYPAPQVRVAGGDDPRPSQAVTTREGPVAGVRNDAGTVEIFAGIPYAQPPVGELRWQAPRPPEPRTEVLSADRFSAAPVQSTSTFATRALSQVVDAPLENTLLNPYPVSEDSLYLNVWRGTEPTSDRLPVLVYIPGGGFATGSGALPLYDGEALASSGQVIVATINYRLGVLGFLSHPELAAESEYGASGNYGILDQIAALDWIRQNIAAFGGDRAVPPSRRCAPCRPTGSLTRLRESARTGDRPSTAMCWTGHPRRSMRTGINSMCRLWWGATRTRAPWCWLLRRTRTWTPTTRRCGRSTATTPGSFSTCIPVRPRTRSSTRCCSLRPTKS